MKAKTYLHNADGTMPQAVREEFSDDVIFFIRKSKEVFEVNL